MITLPIDNTTDSKIRRYQGVLLSTLLDQVFNKQWKHYDAIKFIAEDGYHPIIPVANILAHKGLIAIGEESHLGFSPLTRKTGEVIAPGSFYLMWENIIDASANKDNWLSGAWQLSRIELTNFAQEYPHSSPPHSADSKINQGFIAFQQHCIKCHTINGDGGKEGPELNYPMNVTEYWREDVLVKFIADPQSVRYSSKMLAFYRDTDNRTEIIDSVIAYLKSMKNKKIAP